MQLIPKSHPGKCYQQTQHFRLDIALLNLYSLNLFFCHFMFKITLNLFTRLYLFNYKFSPKTIHKNPLQVIIKLLQKLCKSTYLSPFKFGHLPGTFHIKNPFHILDESNFRGTTKFPYQKYTSLMHIIRPSIGITALYRCSLLLFQLQTPKLPSTARYTGKLSA